MTWTLARNLQLRHDAIEAAWPGTVIGEVGDPKHQAEKSDHNPDSRGIVHAIDAMTYGDEVKAAAILAWLAASHADLQYWIHDRLIYDIAADFRPAPYTGSDPHTDHVHMSGRHGTTGKNTATGVGYSTAAEAMTPPPLEDDMTAADDILNARIDNVAPPAAGAPVTLEQAIRMMYYRTDYLGNTFAPAVLVALKAITPAALGAAVVAALPPSVVGGLTEAQVGQAVHEQLVSAAQAEATALAAGPAVP